MEGRGGSDLFTTSVISTCIKKNIPHLFTKWVMETQNLLMRTEFLLVFGW